MLLEKRLLCIIIKNFVCSNCITFNVVCTIKVINHNRIIEPRINISVHLKRTNYHYRYRHCLINSRLKGCTTLARKRVLQKKYLSTYYSYTNKTHIKK